MSKGVINVGESCYYPFGYTMTDNRIEDYLQRLLSPSAYVVWRQYLRFWGGNKDSAAYPSLAYLSKRTGMSEKTIRKCNRELVEKNFMLYISGNSKKANQYYYVPIEKIMTIHYGNEFGPDGRRDEDNKDIPPIKQKEKKTERKIQSLLESLEDDKRSLVEDFVNVFKSEYKNKMGLPYSVEYSDISTIVTNLEELNNNYRLYTGLITQYFSTTNKFIENSDYSIHFLFVPKVKKALLSEYYQTNYGRWLTQAEKIAEELDKGIKDNNIKDARQYIDNNIKLSGANSERDNFVYNTVINKLLSE